MSGNDCCDLDSIVCALVYAHYISSTPNPPTESLEAGPIGDRCEVALPLLQCRRADLAARQEGVLLLEELCTDPSTLLFLDDITHDVLAGVQKLSIVLVDHNAPTGM